MVPDDCIKRFNRNRRKVLIDMCAQQRLDSMASRFTIYTINQISDLIVQISYTIYKISDILDSLYK